MSPTPIEFPADFLWGAATSSHQVDGANVHSDWWAWEHDVDAKVKVAEPSGEACDHRHRFAADIGLLASLGLNAYRFSIEWARIEPWPGEFDEHELARAEAMVDACVQHGLTPIVTLQHFTLPRWVSRAGSWTNPDMPTLFARYARRVVERIGDRVGYFCTINEPGNLLVRGYLGTFPTPPFVRDLAVYRVAVGGLNRTHRLVREVVKGLAPDARVGMAHGLQAWQADVGGRPIMEFARYLHEDAFFSAVTDDDFIGVQTYTRLDVHAPGWAGPVVTGVLRSDKLSNALLLPLIRRAAVNLEDPDAGPSDVRRTQLGWPWAPEAVEVTARRMARLFPGEGAADQRARVGLGGRRGADRVPRRGPAYGPLSARGRPADPWLSALVPVGQLGVVARLPTQVRADRRRPDHPGTYGQALGPLVRPGGVVAPTVVTPPPFWGS